MENEKHIEAALIKKLEELKYTYRTDIQNKKALESNFRKKFEALNRVYLTDSEFIRLQGEIITADAFTASKFLRARNTFQREDGTPLQYTLVNTSDF